MIGADFVSVKKEGKKESWGTWRSLDRMISFVGNDAIESDQCDQQVLILILILELVPVGKSAVLGGSMPKLRSLLKEMNDMVIGPYLCGERMTLADCAAFPFLWRIEQDYGIGSNGDEEKLRTWLDVCLKTESMNKTVVQSWWWWW